MEEEKASMETQDTVEASAVEPTPDGAQNDDAQNSGKSSRFIIIGFVVVAVLVLIGLFLPPISLGQRLGLGASPTPTATVADDPTAAPSPTDTVVASSPAIPDEFEVVGAETAVVVAAVPPATCCPPAWAPCLTMLPPWAAFTPLPAKARRPVR